MTIARNAAMFGCAAMLTACGNSGEAARGPDCRQTVERFASAIADRDYATAARLWLRNGEMDASTLERIMGGIERPQMEIAALNQSAVAGGVLCDAQVSLIDRDRAVAPRNGTMSLRRPDGPAADEAGAAFRISEASFEEPMQRVREEPPPFSNLPTGRDRRPRP